jgi:hypothetical protein
VGVVHYRIEFSLLTHEVIRREKPDVICVDLPFALEKELIPCIHRLPYHSVIIFDSDDSGQDLLIVDPSDGVIEAARSALENQIPLHMINPQTTRLPMFTNTVADPYVVDKIGQKAYVEQVLSKVSGHDGAGGQDPRVGQYIVSKLQDLAGKYNKVLFVCGLERLVSVLGLLEYPQAQPLMKPSLKAMVSAPLHPDSLKKGFMEIPRLTEVFERWRRAPQSQHPENRHELILNLMDGAAQYFTGQTHQEVPDYTRLTWFRFLRKWLKVKGELLPDMYHMVASARSAMDEDFAYHVHEFISDYEWTNDPADPGAILVDEDSLRFHGHKITLHKKLRRFFSKSQKYRMKAVSGAKWKEHLKKKWETADPHEVDICSFPPEDVNVEQWGDTLMKHATNLLQASANTSEPFVADFGRGPDVRETLRHFFEKRVYIKREDPGGLEFGSVVVVFDPDEENERYPFLMTWLGEHSQESDMAFFSTRPGEQVIGPGISRMEYGGFMMSYPPLRMFDIWMDPEFSFVETKSDRLLVAGVAYSEKTGVVYVAKTPPRDRWKKLAKSMGKRIIYIPLGSLNPMHVKKMRTFHMLQNKGVRNYAHEYLKNKY